MTAAGEGISPGFSDRGCAAAAATSLTGRPVGRGMPCVAPFVGTAAGAGSPGVREELVFFQNKEPLLQILTEFLW